jgi:hypothetical protein
MREGDDAHTLRVRNQIVAAAEIITSGTKVFTTRGSIIGVRQAYNAIRFKRNRIIAVPQCLLTMRIRAAASNQNDAISKNSFQNWFATSHTDTLVVDAGGCTR